MLCFSNLKKSLLYSLLFSFLVLSFSLVSNVADTSALEDLSITLDSDHMSNVVLCSSSDGSSWCGRKYLVITKNTSSFSLTYKFKFSGSSTVNNNTIVVNYSDFLILSPIHASDPTRSYTDLTFSSSLFFNSGQYYTITATDDLSSFIPSGCDPSPSGNIDITENGTYDVTNYATATVNIENEIIYGDYHNDLININNSILICGAICLVLYFFYSIYRMIIKSAGGN